MTAANTDRESSVEHWLDTIEPPEFQIALAGRNIQDMMNSVLRQHELKLVEWRILDCLATRQKLTIFDLAERAVVDRTVASRMADKLSERGLDEKVLLKTDRRFAQVSLTASGQNLLTKANHHVQQARAGLFSDFTHDEAELLGRTLEKLAVNAAHKHLR